MGPHDLAHLALLQIGAMLGRDHDRGRLDGLAVDILQGDLALGVGAEAGLGAGMAGFGEGAQDLMGVIDRRRHELRGLAAGIAEHDALVARTLVLIAQRIDALGDIGGLLMDQDIDLGILPVEAVLLIADVADGLAGHVLQQILGHRGGPADLARQDHLVRRRQRFAGDARVGIGAEIGIDDGVGDAVANLVGVTLGHGFAGEEIISMLGQEGAPSDGGSRMALKRPPGPMPSGSGDPSGPQGAGSWSGPRSGSREDYFRHSPLLPHPGRGRPG